MTSHRTPQRCVSLALVLALLATPALAQTSSPPGSATQLSDSLQGPSKEAYDSARLLVTNHDYAGALTKFDQAYRLSKDPRLLYDMAVCEKSLRHYARMQALLQQYVHDGGGVISAESRAAVDDALSAIKSLVATIDVKVSETGATVVLDGETAGTTPLASPLTVDLGKHLVIVRKAGFAPVEQTVETPGGAPTAVVVTLAPQGHVGHIIVTASDSATILVDAAVAGKGGFDSTLPSGMHEVRVTEAGKVPYKTDVELHDGETRTMQVTLESEHGAAIWPWIVGGVVVAAGAAVGGYFLLKPQDQTVPVPPGALGSVHFATWR